MSLTSLLCVCCVSLLSKVSTCRADSLSRRDGRVHLSSLDSESPFFTFSVPNGLTRWIWAIKRIYITSLTTSYCCRCSLSLLLVYSFSLLLCLRLPDPIEGLPKRSALTAIRRDIGRRIVLQNWWMRKISWMVWVMDPLSRHVHLRDPLQLCPPYL